MPRFHFNHAGVLNPKALPKLRVNHAAPHGIDGCQGWNGAIDEGARNAGNASCIKIQDMLVGPAGMRRLSPLYPIVIFGSQAKHRRVGWWETVVDAFSGSIDARLLRGAGMRAAPTLAWFGNHCVEVDQMLQSIGTPVSDRGAQHAGIRVHNQNGVLHFLRIERLQHILHMGF